MSETIREFNTKNFQVKVLVRPDDDLDLSWDEDGEVLRKLQTGEYQAFWVEVVVVHRPTGIVLGQDSLSGCVYESPEKFMDHRECAAENRRLAASGAVGRCGSYFADMIREAIAAARRTLEVLRAS